MSRLSAILLVCLASSIPALAADDAESSAQGEIRPLASSPAPDLPAALRDLEDLPPEILEKLDGEQITEILLAREEGSKVLLGNFDPGDSDLVPIVAVGGFYLAILLGLIATLVLRYRRHAQLQGTLRLMIEKGANIPPDLIAPPVPPYGDLRRGVILVGAGLSLAICVGLVEGFGGGEWAVGLIPAFIGAGYLLVWRLSRRSENG